MDTAARERRQLLSLCAGDGRDVIPVLTARAASSSISDLLIERDEELSCRATEAAASSGLSTVEIRCAHAGDPASFSDVLPVDVLLLCGRVGCRWTVFCENLVEATKEARNRFVAHRLRLSLRLQGLRR